MTDDQEVAGLGARLREHRLASRLPLESAAARVGLSPAYLSRLETGQRQPSLPVLLGLARAYGTSVSGLLGEQPAEPDPVIRGGAIEPGRAGGWGYRRAGSPGRAMQALRVQVPPSVQDAVVRVHPGEEWLYVTRGRMRLTLGDTVHLLDEGDSAHFDSLTPHCIAAPHLPVGLRRPAMARQASRTMDAGLPAERRVWLRAIVYIAVPHFFLGFLALLFYIGHGH